MSLMTGYSETLTKVGLKYVQDPAAFKAGIIFPVCPVKLLSSTYPTYDKEYWMKNEAKLRSPGTESAGGVHARGTGSYTCADVAFHEDVPDEYVKNDPAPLNPLKAATRRVTSKIAIYDEVDFAANFFVTGKWGSNEGTPATLWSAGGDPFGDVDGYKRTVKVATAKAVDTFVMSEPVYDILKRHADVKDQIKYTTSANVTEELLARLFEVDRLIVLGAVYDSAKYGATASQSFIAANNALLLATTSSPSLEEPSAGYNFAWTGFGSNGYGVRKFYREEPLATRVEAHYYHVMKQMATDLGYMILAPIA